MLISFQELLPFIKNVKGIIHIGAHECEERQDYMKILNIGDDKTLWFDAMPFKVNEMKTNIPSLQIYHECLSNQDNETVHFKVTNNYQSSSILNLKTHLTHHPHIHNIFELQLKTKKMSSFIQEKNIDMNQYNFLNIDIQGAELLALKGFEHYLSHIDYIYSEVNIEELYENCALIHQLDEYLLQFGFVRIITKMTEYKWGDAFYVKILKQSS
jgi:FkbM family methyltransferase